MRTTLLILIVLTTVRGFSQSLPIAFSDCDHDYVWAVVHEPPEWAIDSITVAEYFNQACLQSSVDIYNANGKIIIEILVFEDGKPCCYSILDKTSINYFPYQHFKKMVDEMPFWIPGKQSGKIGNVIVKLVLELKSGVFISG